MVEVVKHSLKPTALIPNSPWPLLHYPGILSPDSDRPAVRAYELFESNGWQTQWIFRYGSTQLSHYHSQTHECMAVLSGTATIRFGVADTVDDLEENTHGSGWEPGGIELEARAGDVFVIPAGTAHKTFNARPLADLELLTPGDGHEITTEDIKKTLNDLELSGFTMIGAYPKHSGQWDFARGGEHVGNYEKVWHVSKPENDPILGRAEEGLCKQWQ